MTGLLYEENSKTIEGACAAGRVCAPIVCLSVLRHRSIVYSVCVTALGALGALGVRLCDVRVAWVSDQEAA